MFAADHIVNIGGKLTLRRIESGQQSLHNVLEWIQEIGLKTMRFVSLGIGATIRTTGLPLRVQISEGAQC